MPSPNTLNTDILSASLGKPIALAYGRHWVGGNVILLDQSVADLTTAFVALGEGEWDAVEALSINGIAVDFTLAPASFHFHKGLQGEKSESIGDDGSTNPLFPEGQGSAYPFDANGDQKADGYTPAAVQGFTFSRISYLALQVPFDPHAPDADLHVVGQYRCRKVSIRDAAGAETAFQWSDNPAWCIADLLVAVRGLATSRIDWQSFIDSAAFCDALIDPFGDGTQVKRFVCNVAFTEEVDLDQALDALLVTCRGFLLDSEGKISLRIDQIRTSIFDFTMDNIVDGSFSTFYKDTRQTPNRLELMFRDPDNGFQVITKPWNHEAHQARVGRIIPTRVQLGNLPQHQAERLGSYLLQRAISNNLHAKLRGDPSSFKLMPGDVVRVKHDAAPWSQQDFGDTLFEIFEVLEVSDNPDETRDYLLRIYRDATYTDLAGPAQLLIGTVINRFAAPPPQTPNWNLTANLGGDLRLAFAIPNNADYRGGHLTVLVDEDKKRFYGGGENTIGFTLLNGALNPGASTVTVNSSAGFLVGDYVTIGHEIIQITGPGTAGLEPTSTTWQIGRAQKDTLENEAGVANDNATVRRLTERILSFVIPAGYSLTHPTKILSSGPYYEVIFRPGRLTILHAALVLNGPRSATAPLRIAFAAFGLSEPTVAGALPGLRVAAGGALFIKIPGPLRAGEDLAEPLILPIDVCLGDLFVTVETAPTGQSIKGRIKIDDLFWQDSLLGPTVDVAFELFPGALGSGTFAVGDFLGNLGDKSLLLVLDQVGTAEPGRDLTLTVYI